MALTQNLAELLPRPTSKTTGQDSNLHSLATCIAQQDRDPKTATRRSRRLQQFCFFSKSSDAPFKSLVCNEINPSNLTNNGALCYSMAYYIILNKIKFIAKSGIELESLAPTAEIISLDHYLNSKLISRKYSTCFLYHFLIS